VEYEKRGGQNKRKKGKIRKKMQLNSGRGTEEQREEEKTDAK
jgi:hypothetical protein